jgi:hypothetical protein
MSEQTSKREMPVHNFRVTIVRATKRVNFCGIERSFLSIFSANADRGKLGHLVHSTATHPLKAALDGAQTPPSAYTTPTYKEKAPCPNHCIKSRAVRRPNSITQQHHQERADQAHFCIAQLVTLAAGDAYMNNDDVSPVPKRSPMSRRLKVTASGAGRPRVDVPYMRLRGLWLERAGFVVGRHVKIEVGKARLTIEQLD